MLPDARFLHNMGVASIVAGLILLGLAALSKRPMVRRYARGRR